MWPPGAGEMARRVREHAWRDTPLGPTDSWPASLKSIVDMLLSSGFAMVALWGRGLISIYNDAYADLIGAKHPDAFGRPTQEAWPELWPVVAPVIERVWAGETITFVDAQQQLVRRGKAEDGWFTNCYSPLRDETGGVAGVLVTLLETSARVRSEAALRASEERFRTLLHNIRDYAIFLLDEAGYITEWSEGATRVFGYSDKTIVGHHVSILYSPDDASTGTPAAELQQTRTNERAETEG